MIRAILVSAILVSIPTYAQVDPSRVAKLTVVDLKKVEPKQKQTKPVKPAKKETTR